MNTFNNPDDKNVYSSRQLEWATRKQDGGAQAEDFSPEEIPSDLESLEQAWRHFGTLLDTASDADFLPAAQPTSAPTPIRRAVKTRLFPALYALCSVLIAVVFTAVFYSQISQKAEKNSSESAVAVTPVSTEVPNVSPLNSEANAVSEETLAWTEDSQYDTALNALSDSILNASSSGVWELSALADYNAVGTALEEDSNGLF